MSNSSIGKIESMALKFKALANPVRLKIFIELTQCCAPGRTCEVQRCVGDLASLVNIAPSTLSHHLKELSYAGLIDMERAGKNIMCSVDMKVLKAMSDYFKELSNRR